MTITIHVWSWVPFAFKKKKKFLYKTGCVDAKYNFFFFTSENQNFNDLFSVLSCKYTFAVV